MSIGRCIFKGLDCTEDGAEEADDIDVLVHMPGELAGRDCEKYDEEREEEEETDEQENAGEG